MNKIKKVLVANRGEIAIRVIRACKEFGLASVAVYSEADKNCLHVLFADEKVCIGPPDSINSYLDPRRIISAAIITNSDAIHPGYGFLAENADFAEICEAHNIEFIGPTSDMIRIMGDKAQAKKLMQHAKVPTIPGSEGTIKDVAEANKLANKIGYPVIIKATAGGGGKGMRICRDDSQLKSNFKMATLEAEKAFGNPKVYMEKFIENPHHIEVQLLGDGDGNILSFAERDCSIQRQHQKLIEESPSPAVTPKIRKKLCQLALAGAKKIKYRSAGTMEFLLDDTHNFYFMEMNARIQVEHPVTELVHNIDLIKEQLRVALGNKMKYRQKDLKLTGHSIECRINAEDPFNNFAPSPGKITTFHPPGGPGIRVDTHIYSGYVIPSYYDSMLAKLIVSADTREACISRMKRALDEFVIEGVKTTIPFHKKVFENKNFVAGTFNTSFLKTNRITE